MNFFGKLMRLAKAKKYAAIVAEYQRQENPNLMQLGIQFGVCATTVDHCLREAGCKPVRLRKDGAPWGKKSGGQGGHSPIPEETRAKIVAAFRENPNPMQIGIQFGVSQTTVVKYVKKAGAALRPARHPRPAARPSHQTHG
jgi:hypothetical protein